MKRIRISFIIPVYNVEKYIRKCIQSISCQSLKEIEIICVDDCSKDSSLDIIRECMTYDDRVVLFSNERNEGLSYSRNVGLKNARGEYIWFVDPDDWIVNNRSAECLYTKAKEKCLDIVLFDSEIEYESAHLREQFGQFERTQHHNESIDNNVLSGEDLYTYMEIHGLYRSAIPFQLFRRDFLITNDLFFSPIIHEDMLYAVEVLLVAERVLYDPSRHYCYFRRENSLTSLTDLSARRITAFVFVIVELYRRLQSLELKSETYFALSCYFNRLKLNVKRTYIECIKTSQCITFGDSAYKLCFNLIMNEFYPYIFPVISHDIFLKIYAAKRILIYGAGTVSGVVQRFLEDLGIEEYQVVVSKDGKHPIKNIDEIEERSADTLILLSVAGKNQKEMMEHAGTLGFTNIVVMA